MENVKAWKEEVEREYAKTVVGYEGILEEILIGLLAGGHVLLEGVPGVGKTLIVKTIARIVGLDFRRIQFTPDLMPADILGTSVFDPRNLQFQLRLGPIFSSFLLADEINRTPPRTQAALLEAMEERQVTIDGETHSLPTPFMVFATQNPVEYEGTFALPEAQLDRFMLKIILDYPSPKEENEILRRHCESAQLSLADPIEVNWDAIRSQVQAVRIDANIIDYIQRLIQATRINPQLSLGVSPRGGVHMVAAAKALAAISGRDFVIPDDIKGCFLSVLRHRVILRPEAEMEGYRSDEVLQQIISTIPVPR